MINKYEFFVIDTIDSIGFLYNVLIIKNFNNIWSFV